MQRVRGGLAEHVELRITRRKKPRTGHRWELLPHRKLMNMFAGETELRNLPSRLNARPDDRLLLEDVPPQVARSRPSDSLSLTNALIFPTRDILMQTLTLNAPRFVIFRIDLCESPA